MTALKDKLVTMGVWAGNAAAIQAAMVPTGLTTSAVVAYTTTGTATLSTAQTSNLTTTQLTALCADHDLVKAELVDLRTQLNTLITGLNGDTV